MWTTEKANLRKSVQQLKELLVNGALEINPRGMGSKYSTVCSSLPIKTYLMELASSPESEEHEEKLKLFLQHGADVTLCTWDEGQNALHMAARNGNTSMCRILLDHVQEQGSTENNDKEGKYHRFLYRRDHDGMDALHHASSCGKEEVVAFLLARGALDRIDADLSTGRLVYHRDRFSYSYPHEERNEPSCNELHSAARNGYTEVCRLLLDHVAGVDTTNDKDPTDFAENKAHSDYLHSRDKTGMDALQHASCRMDVNGDGHVEAVKFLLLRGASVFTFSKWRYTAIHNAAEQSCLDTLQPLLEAADKEEENGSSKALLHKTGDKKLAIHLVLASYQTDSSKSACFRLFMPLLEKDPESAAKMVKAPGGNEKKTPLELLFSEMNMMTTGFPISILEFMLEAGALVKEEMIQTIEEKVAAPAQPSAAQKGKQILDLLQAKHIEQVAEKKRKREEQATKRAAKKNKPAATPLRRSSRR